MIYSSVSQCQISLTAIRFQQKLAANNLEPWAEFDLVGKTTELAAAVHKHDGVQNAYPLSFCIGLGLGSNLT